MHLSIGFRRETLPFAGGWASGVIARLTAELSGEIITANADAGSITICFPE